MKHKPSNAPNGGVCKIDGPIQSYVKKPACNTVSNAIKKAKGKSEPAPNQWTD